MTPKGNPYPSREPSPRRESSLPHQNNEVRKSPDSGGFIRDFILGPPKGSPVRNERPMTKKSEESKLILEKRKGGLHANEVRTEFKEMTQFQTKMDSDERLDLANDLTKKYEDTDLKDVIKQEKEEKKEMSLGETRQERLDATHRFNALKILEKKKK